MADGLPERHRGQVTDERVIQVALAGLERLHRAQELLQGGRRVDVRHVLREISHEPVAVRPRVVDNGLVEGRQADHLGVVVVALRRLHPAEDPGGVEVQDDSVAVVGLLVQNDCVVGGL